MMGEGVSRLSAPVNIAQAATHLDITTAHSRCQFLNTCQVKALLKRNTNNQHLNIPQVKVIGLLYLIQNFPSD